jgi:hypothetical protein
MADHDPVPTSSSGVFRRDFVRSAVAAAAVGPFVIGRAPRAAAARLWPAARDPDVLTVGLIGCGGRGTGAAFNALSAEDGTVRLVAMADVFPDRLESSLAHLREALGPGREPLVDVPPERRHVGFEAAHALIGSDVDVVLLATPPHFRPAHLRAAVTAGKHVFTEKPMAVDGPGVRSVLETAALAQRQDLSLVSGFCSGWLGFDWRGSVSMPDNKTAWPQFWHMPPVMGPEVNKLILSPHLGQSVNLLLSTTPYLLRNRPAIGVRLIIAVTIWVNGNNAHHKALNYCIAVPL